MPHLSLVYGQLEARVREEAAAGVQDEVRGAGVRVDKLEVWSTEGTPADWHLLHSFPLAGGV
jgi:hypothetical protein